MKAQTLRTVIVQRDDLVDVHAMLAKLQYAGLTAAESGVADEASINDVELVGTQVVFDGFFWTVFLFVTTG